MSLKANNLIVIKFKFNESIRSETKIQYSNIAVIAQFEFRVSRTVL